jgi:PKHD-type hydroxylase
MVKTSYALDEKRQDNPTCHYILRDLFNEEELDYLAKKARSAQEQASIGEGTINNSIRRTKINWVSPDKTKLWIFKRLETYVERINKEIFNFELSSISAIQLANYKSEEKGKYDWHLDCGKGPIRKLSIAIQLNDPSEYEGGEFCFMTGSDETKLPKEKGLAVLFPSFLLHRVAPVTSGERQSLVCWVQGTRPFS